ncbi:hypothetical protein L6R21_06345 [bacterium]|nr:hypothetical protein [bacterium]
MKTSEPVLFKPAAAPLALAVRARRSRPAFAIGSREAKNSARKIKQDCSSAATAGRRAARFQPMCGADFGGLGGFLAEMGTLAAVQVA